MTAVLATRGYSGTRAERLAFGVPVAFAGLTTWRETDTGFDWFWNSVQAVWVVAGGLPKYWVNSSALEPLAPYATIQAMINGMVADGHTPANPATGLIWPGIYAETLALAPGCYLQGIDDAGGAGSGAVFPVVTINGSITATGTDAGGNDVFRLCNIGVRTAAGVGKHCLEVLGEYSVCWLTNCRFIQENANRSAIKATVDANVVLSDSYAASFAFPNIVPVVDVQTAFSNVNLYSGFIDSFGVGPSLTAKNLDCEDSRLRGSASLSATCNATLTRFASTTAGLGALVLANNLAASLFGCEFDGTVGGAAIDGTASVTLRDCTFPNSTLIAATITQVAPSGCNYGGIIFGTYGNPATGSPRAGTRPLASSVAHGTQWIPQDDRIVWTSAPRASDPTKSIWLPASSPSTRSLQATVAGPNAAVAAHFGVYNPAANTFTPASVSGQNCNATAAQGGASGATIFVILFPATAALSAPYAGVIAGEIMSDGTGFAIPYVNNGVNVPLGIALVGNAVAANLSILMYEY